MRWKSVHLLKRVHLWNGNTWEERRLSNVQTEPQGHKTAETSRPGRSYRDTRPHADPEGHIERWPDFGWDHVAGDVHEGVASTALISALPERDSKSRTNPTLRIDTATLKSLPVRLRSSSNELSRASLGSIENQLCYEHRLSEKQAYAILFLTK